MSSPASDQPRTDDDDDTSATQRPLLLDWSDQQRRILTANGKAAEYYQSSRGFPFDEKELPHTYYVDHDKLNSFVANSRVAAQSCPIVGVWNRPLFVGEWEHSTNDLVYNIQANAWFIDLRIPQSRPPSFATTSSYEDLTGMELRLFARQHVFAGVTHCHLEDNAAAQIKIPEGFAGYATRYHTMDWNYVGNARNRPNKWWIELMPAAVESRRAVWKEYSFATNPAGQYYYWERWESAVDNDEHRSSTPPPVVMAFQRCSPYYGIVVVVGDHFNYCCHNVTQETLQTWCEEYQAPPQQIVDNAVAEGNLEVARRIVSRMTGGHGRIIVNTHNNQVEWKIDLSTEPWNQGHLFWDSSTVQLDVRGDSMDTWRMHGQHGEEWKILRCSSVVELQRLFPETVENTSKM